MNDVLAGHIQMGFVSAGSAVPNWKAGKLKLIAVGGKKRLPELPDVPTVAETVPGFEAVSWFGLFGPAGMPPAVVDKINREVRALFSDPEFQQTFLSRYLFQSIAGSPEELMSFIKSEEPKWRKIIQDAKIKVQ
jgi:tripartite-type tricarboxylate transporter receptor subunit TctC